MSEGLARSSALQITGSFPIPFLLVAFAVLFLRLEEPNAWLLALLFCAFAAAPNLPNSLAISPALRAFAFAFRAVFSGMLSPLFYLFFAVFPVQSLLDRRLPWLKWVGLLYGALYCHSWLADWVSKPSTRSEPPVRQPQRQFHQRCLELRLAYSGHNLAGAEFIHGRRPGRSAAQVASDSVGNLGRRPADRARTRGRRISPDIAPLSGSIPCWCWWCCCIPSPSHMRW